MVARCGCTSHQVSEQAHTRPSERASERASGRANEQTNESAQQTTTESKPTPLVELDEHSACLPTECNCERGLWWPLVPACLPACLSASRCCRRYHHRCCCCCCRWYRRHRCCCCRYRSATREREKLLFFFCAHFVFVCIVNLDVAADRMQRPHLGGVGVHEAEPSVRLVPKSAAAAQ